jgi:TonB system transport protein ExbD (group 1)
MALRVSGAEDDLAEMHEINVTPFIDVMLVLLIIFMIAAPLATVNVPVQLPAIDATRSPQTDKPLTLSLNADLSLRLGETPLARDALGAALAQAAEGRSDRRIYLRADKAVPYGELMNVMNLLRAAGFLDVALVGLESGKTP